MESVVDILQKVLTFVSSRRLWAVAITCVLSLLALAHNVDIPLDKVDPLVSQAMVYVGFLVEIARAVVVLLGGGALVISFTSRPPTRKDYM